MSEIRSRDTRAAVSQDSSGMNRASVSARVEQLLVQAAPTEQKLARAFAEIFWRSAADEDLAERDVGRDAAMSLSCLKALERTAVGPSIDIFVLAEGKTTTAARCALRLVHPDMPFLIDSILMELAHRDLVIHYLHNASFHLRRDAQGQLLNFYTPDTPDAPDTPEADCQTLIYVEIDALSAEEMDALSARLAHILLHVRSVVDDYKPMKARVEHFIGEFGDTAKGVEPAAAATAANFLRWLLADHFTFLGYREFDFTDGTMRQVPNTALGFMRHQQSSSPRSIAQLTESMRKFLLEPSVLSFSKSGSRSLVHRPAYPDYIGIKQFDTHGQVIGECGFLGLFTSPVYTVQPSTIPLIGDKVARVLERSHFDAKGFDGKALRQVLATFPRDALFQSTEDELFDAAMKITHIHERRRTRLIVRRNHYGMFFTCLVYLPRDLFNTAVRERIQKLLCESLQALDVEFDAYFSESILVRLHFLLRVHPNAYIPVDEASLEAQLIELSRDWHLDLHRALADRDRELARSFHDAFPVGYRERFGIQVALQDAECLAPLQPSNDLAIRFHSAEGNRLGLKIFHHGDKLPLSNIVPILEHLGFEVMAEHPYLLQTTQGRRSIQDFDLRYPESLDIDTVGERFESAFINIWHQRTENDCFNGLILGADLNWRQVMVLRAYARYMKQTRFGFSQEYIGQTLLKHTAAAALLAQHFVRKFDPVDTDGEDTAGNLADEIVEYLVGVDLLNEDRILRRLLLLMQSTLRTNYFQKETDGKLKERLVFKIATATLDDLPLPKPAYELFVYAPDVEGVHLRSGPIARGGLRWSDRHEDYRTEVLGLVKAQMVKNAVIVPAGAKGGFVVKRATNNLSRDEVQSIGIASYQTFVRGLLDVTDNIVNDIVVHPDDTRCFDGPDPYLVVAADKGTAAFSDIANAIAQEYRFWLGDAFASGGSNGYDHKVMGITARGAWVSVQRHFMEAGVNVQADPVQVIGIGDMSGDVFGNGLLLSPSIQLVAAFNHAHIFIDPAPSAEISLAERRRLFLLPRSGWNDYDNGAISTGGGVFSRTQKSIAISQPMRDLLNIEEAQLTPDRLIQAILRAPVDLLWNGGIGTYIKATTESDEMVGDRANDAVRINANELRVRVVGEGGNLGLTQWARVEFALAGGAINTDFIDNAGGVDCSDHEVNIKILLGEALACGDIEPAERNWLLEQLDAEVAELVLSNNIRQTLCLSLAKRHSATRFEEYARLLERLEEHLQLDRADQGIAADDALAERAAHGNGFTRPELAVMLGYAKIYLKAQLLGCGLDNDPVISRVAATAFPQQLRTKYSSAITRHRLHNEIVCTQVANSIVDRMGMTFVNRLVEFVGCTALEAVQAYWAVQSMFDFDEQWGAIESLSLNASHKLELLLEIIRLGRRATRWLIRNNRGRLQPATLLQRFAEPVRSLLETAPGSFMSPVQRAAFDEASQQLEKAGLPSSVARKHAHVTRLLVALPVVEVAQRTHRSALEVIPIFAEMGVLLGTDTLIAQLDELDGDHWQAMERDALLDDVLTQQLELTSRAINAQLTPSEWAAKNSVFMRDWNRVLADLRPGSITSITLYSMTVRKLGDLTKQIEA